MVVPSKPLDEEERLAELYKYEILDTNPEEDFDQLVELASAICEVPISLVSLIDRDRQWFKAKKGLDIDETSRDVAFCAHAILQDEVFIVENALEDIRFFDNPYVVNDGIRFYAGMPIKTRNGKNLGTLCVIDHEPKILSTSQKRALEILGRQVVNLMELRLTNNRQKELITLLDKQKEELKAQNEFNSRLIKLLAHDIKSPLTSIKGGLDLILDGHLQPNEATQIFKDLSNSIDSTLQMVNDTLRWGLLNIRKELVLEPIHLHTMIEEIKDLYKFLLKSKHILFFNNVPEDYILYSDPESVEIILRNFIQNSIKYTENGTVKVSVNDNDSFRCISVTDTGKGMTPAQLQAINHQIGQFLSTPGTHGEKGTGFGLRMCLDLAKSIGANIYASSEEGKGTQFKLIFKQD
ncbi:GAF domain-containing sensor histidine kinase [Thermaurantimonas aggregans]|uniref:GAF domain-containing sensor histidine kinase n=1 Tax=Thermaurantimonas aggregans TaxID=2173829 RepID=UPI0023F15BCE|nr:GAF domain-containing sensor histidine kinase [Thermaurantimonas aggregans]MCX8148674.1 GAF domain-containing sensor histidine kinase [Thermaurantimonas aggregans]